MTSLGYAQEHEGIDRTNITLPGLQEKFALAVFDIGKPTVIVLVNGGVVAIDNLIAPASAIVEAFYPGTRSSGVRGLLGLRGRYEVRGTRYGVRGYEVWGYEVRGTGYGVRGYEVRGTRYGVRGTGYGVRGTGYGVRGTGYGVRGMEYEGVFCISFGL